MTIEAFPGWVTAGHWAVVEQPIRAGDYQPAPVRRVEIDKPDGGKRQLGIPMDQTSPFPVKRPVRTRMQGVVGAGG